MARFPTFIGPSYTGRATSVAIERAVNVLPERQESPGAKASYVYHGRPGLAVFAALADESPVRALFAQDGRAFAVIGAAFVEVLSNGTLLSRGAVDADDESAQITSNGSAGGQLFVVASGKGYIYDLGLDTFTEITDAEFAADVLMGGFADGYFLALRRDGTSFQISDLEDGTSWDGADVGQRSQGADLMQALALLHREVWLFGSLTTEVWYNSGSADFPYTPVPGVFIDQGIGAPWSVALLDGTLWWLGQDTRGSRIVYRAEGYQPLRMSTHAMEAQLATYVRVDDAIGYSYTEEGHGCYVLTFPTAGATWVYDVASGLWHEESWFNTTTALHEAALGRCQCAAWDHVLIGDRQSGTIYRQSLSLRDDAGTPIIRLRRAPHIGSESQRLVHHRFELAAEVGVGVVSGQGSDPQVSLRWSDDGGKTWGNEHWASLGPLGEYRRRAVWRRLGQSRNRVYEVSMSDPVQTTWIEAFLEVSAEAA